MEAAKEQQSTGLLDKILPPRLEDAGLEDCALPADSIKEAFLKAASAVKSRIFSDDEDTDCVQDPWPEAKEFSDQVVLGPPVSAAPDSLAGLDVEKDPTGPCVVEKGRAAVEEAGDKVAVGGGDVQDKREEKGCVDDAFKGLKIGDKEGENRGSDEQAENEGERPILTEGVV